MSSNITLYCNDLYGTHLPCDKNLESLFYVEKKKNNKGKQIYTLSNELQQNETYVSSMGRIMITMLIETI